MDRIVERLPSPGGFALWLYALAFVILPALLAYTGFAYVIGILIFAVGVRPHIESLVDGTPLRFELTWRGRKRIWDFYLRIPNEGWVVKVVSISLLILTMLGLPLIVFAVQQQGSLFYGQIERNLPSILSGIDQALQYAHQQLPGYVPEVDVESGAGWQGLSGTIGQVAGDAIQDLKSFLQSIFGSALGIVGGLLGDWVKLVIAAIIVGTILSGWDKEVAMHRSIVSNGIKDARLRANVLRYGELYQTGVSLFMIGYLEVALTLSILFGVAMIVLPLGLSIGAILFMSLMLGFMTAIPKVGGLLGMAVATLLMITNLEPGLGWFGWTAVTFGTTIDVLVRAGLLIAVAKLLGLLEAYNYTPEIIGQRLGMTKMQIIATVLTWAVGAGFFGMIWGILFSLGFQAAMRLSQEAHPAAGNTSSDPASEVSNTQ
ncbi:MAG: hypothetical protein AAF501_11575 [Pseudomonadota bacterium]